MFSLKSYSPFFNIIFGLLLLFAGQKLFWLFVGVIGFILGFNLAEYYMQDYPSWSVLLVAGLTGFIGIFLAIILQHVAIIFSGILIGGFLAADAYLSLMQNSEFFMWLAFILGAIVGGILFTIFFDWALIIFSALLGSALVTGFMEVQALPENLIFLVLFILGVIVQTIFLRKKELAPAG